MGVSLTLLGNIAKIAGALGLVKTAVDATRQEPVKAFAGGPGQKPAPKEPTVDEAQQTAAEQLKKRRKISLLTGGMTDITEGTGLVPEASVKRKTLLGQ